MAPGRRPPVEDLPFFQAFEATAQTDPDRVAVVESGRRLTYGELNAWANRTAHELIARGVAPGSLVGVAVDRSVDTLVGLLGILKAGAAYVPMDPKYPDDRLRYMAKDSGCAHVVHANGRPSALADVDLSFVDLGVDTLGERPDTNPGIVLDGDALAYVIYTSGSTGNPKGVKVRLRNVANFFAGMDDRIPEAETPGTWLAVTSISFDISVLELLWTVCRGFKVVLYDPSLPTREAMTRPSPASQLPLSLFYFAAEEGAHGENPYRLLLEGARFADESGFKGVWTPERHFHAFGGLYPNAAVTGAAVAAITRNVEIRAGSVVLPLHHPARVAEEWAVVDNISEGRVGIAFASGWHPNDFVLRPSGYANRKAGLFEWAEEVKQLWRGETLAYEGPEGRIVDVRTFPRPVQAELPVWMTAAGSPDTMRAAGLAGHYLLTHLLGQTIEEVAEKVRIYREAWKEGGHEGVGRVALMLHTFVGEDDAWVKEEVRGPMVAYLRASAGLVKNHLASWEAFSKKAEHAAAAKGDEFEKLSEEDLDSLLNFSFERYYETSALLGSTERTKDMLASVLGAGIDEVACLVDFGVPTDLALAGLPLLRDVGASHRPSQQVAAERRNDFASLMDTHQVSHFQCTPSLARMIVADPANVDAFRNLKAVLLGGEALDTSLARDVRAQTSAAVLNMLRSDGGDGLGFIPRGSR